MRGFDFSPATTPEKKKGCVPMSFSNLIVPYAARLDSHVVLTNVPSASIPPLTAMATYPNPAWVQAERMGRSLIGIPRSLNLWGWMGPSLRLPRGLWTHIQMQLGPCPFIEDHRVVFPKIDFHWRGQLRPEQRQAVIKALQSDDGVLVAPPGAGKTNMALAYIAARRQPALFLVPTRELAYQALERARQLFDLPAEAFGLLGDGTECVGTHLTVGIVATLVRRDLPKLSERFGTLVGDESHHVPAQTVRQVVEAFPARYRLGITATPNRQDGLGPMMLAVMGPVSATLTTKDLVQSERLILPQVRQIETQFAYPYTENYHELMAALIADADRNALVVAYVTQEARAGHRILVLSERIAHVQTLYQLCREAAPEIQAEFLTGTTPKSRRMALLDAMRHGDLSVLFASKIADEGLDLPSLDRIALATGGRSESRVAQRVGRIMRPAPGKVGATVLDFVDWNSPVLAAQAKARYWRVYRPLGARVTREGVVA